ncbi:histidine phosphatase family protein [Cellulosilyticum ruminicola]|uniref:histidine phosphatase family protein n=1 Tax=Cellulosilyticum ruminicola TaxID=425254 RepID=UPI0006D2B6DA|nr:histidine phosphatase family protein [Cellulosilyticum ruminicola]
MELYIGKATPEKLDTLVHEKHIANSKIYDGATLTEEELYTADIINGFHIFIQKQLQTSENINHILFKLLLKNPYVIIICDELDNDIVIPTLTKYAQKVMHLQDNTILKNHKNTILCSFIRHGKTTGNLSKRYIGTTNEPLCLEGINLLKDRISRDIYPKAELLYVSPLQRCIETSKLIYPSAHFEQCNALRECDFGEFENKNYKELQGNVNYQKWVDSNSTLPFPNGEDPTAFTKRCVEGFLFYIQNARTYYQSTSTQPKAWTTFIVHGGTIMSIFSQLAYPKGDYFSFQIDNGQGYLCEYNFNTQSLIIFGEL